MDKKYHRKLSNASMTMQSQGHLAQSPATSHKSSSSGISGCKNYDASSGNIEMVWNDGDVLEWWGEMPLGGAYLKLLRCSSHN